MSDTERSRSVALVLALARGDADEQRRIARTIVGVDALIDALVTMAGLAFALAEDGGRDRNMTAEEVLVDLRLRIEGVIGPCTPT